MKLIAILTAFLFASVASAQTPDELGNQAKGAIDQLVVMAKKAQATPTPVPTPVPTATPVPAPSPVASKLMYKPPTLSNPTTITLGTGQTSTTLDKTKDYVIVLPKTKKVGGTTLVGGRNVVIIGGHITIPLSANGKGGSAQRAIYIKDNVGTVHIEGVLIDGSGGGQADAIAIAAPMSIIQIQNVRVDGILGLNSQWHADLIQPWGGSKEVRVHKFTGSSGYQGFQLYATGATAGRDAGKISFTEVNASSVGAQTSDNGGQLLWVIGNGCGDPADVTLNEFYIVPRAVKGLGRGVWPDTTNTQCGFKLSADGKSGSWSNLNTKGIVRLGPPPKGDFVPAGKAGVSYVSPGYN